jgi:hypothetical protein
MTHHDSPLCAALGHYVGTLTVIYCPHEQRWLMVMGSGDDLSDVSIDHERFDFGPFDSADDVARRAESVVSMLVRVHSRLWLDRRRAVEDTRPLDDELY